MISKFARRRSSRPLGLVFVGVVACAPTRSMAGGATTQSGDSLNITTRDSLEVVKIATDTVLAHDPGVPLQVRHFERDSSGFVVTLVPSSATRMGGGGVVHVRHNKTISAITLWQ